MWLYYVVSYLANNIDFFDRVSRSSKCILKNYLTSYIYIYIRFNYRTIPIVLKTWVHVVILRVIF